jgi:thioredoxin reductase
MMPATDYDTIIIGSGAGGLTAAVALAYAIRRDERLRGL